jgi:hypothetical protein
MSSTVGCAKITIHDQRAAARCLRSQVRQAMLSLMSQVAARGEQLRARDARIEQRERDAALKQTLIDKLTHELAVLKPLKFSATSEKFAGSTEQRSLLENTRACGSGRTRPGDEATGRRHRCRTTRLARRLPSARPLPPHRAGRVVLRQIANDRDAGQARGTYHEEYSRRSHENVRLRTLARSRWHCPPSGPVRVRFRPRIFGQHVEPQQLRIAAGHGSDGFTRNIPR